jgi:hypothetical protein
MNDAADGRSLLTRRGFVRGATALGAAAVAPGLLRDSAADAAVLDDTAIVWSSDHGFFLGEHRFYDKRLMYEPSIRIPLVIRYAPRIKAGRYYLRSDGA